MLYLQASYGIYNENIQSSNLPLNLIIIKKLKIKSIHSTKSNFITNLLGSVTWILLLLLFYTIINQIQAQYDRIKHY